MLADCALMRQIGAMPAPAINVENLAARYPAAVALDVISFTAAHYAATGRRAERGLCNLRRACRIAMPADKAKGRVTCS
jgi:hypothetical protein